VSRLRIINGNMAVTAGKIDEIIREYLLYRGLISTSKQLESELKNEKEKKFRVGCLNNRLKENCFSYLLFLYTENIFEIIIIMIIL